MTIDLSEIRAALGADNEARNAVGAPVDAENPQRRAAIAVWMRPD
jgi:hypothetical protein